MIVIHEHCTDRDLELLGDMLAVVGARNGFDKVDRHGRKIELLTPHKEYL